MYYSILIILTLCGCQYLPEVAKEIETIATDMAIVIEVSKETFSKENDVGISVFVKGKEDPTK